MDTLLQDLRYAIRKLRTAPAFTLAAVTCIAVGVGATTSIFSLVNDLLLRPLPGVPDSGRLVEVGRTRNGSGMDNFSWPTFADLRDGARSVDLAAWRMTPLAIGAGDAPELVLGAQVSASYFDVLGVVPVRGRFFAPDEEGPGAGEALLVVSWSFWQERLGAAENVIGQEVTANGIPATIIGVAPSGFQGSIAAIQQQAWMPFGIQGSGFLRLLDYDTRWASAIMALGRLHDGVSLDEAQADLSAVMAALVEAYPDVMEGQGVTAVELRGMPGPLRPVLGVFMTVLMVIVGLVLMVACINVAGMLLARGAARSREIAVRRSLGASRGRLVRQLLVETLTLFSIGGGAGLLLAYWCTGMLVRLDPPTPPPYDMSFALSLDVRVLAFSLTTVLVSALVFGLGPALRASRPELTPALKDASANASPRRARGRTMLLAGQVAMTILLLVMSALFLRALSHAGNLRLGFDPEGVYSLGANLELAGHDADSGRALLRALRDGLEGVAGLESYAFTRLVPLGLPERMGFGSVNAPGIEPPAGWSGFPADINVVSAGYFETLRMPLVAGRDLSAADDASAPGAAVINESMARGLWPDGDPVGREITFTGYPERPLRVAGVVADSKYSSLSDEDLWFVYLPVWQFYQGDLHLLARGDAAVMGTVADLMRRHDPALPMPSIEPLQDSVRIATLPQTLAALVSGILGAVGLLLAGVGIYGVTAYATAQRTREVGLRMALGARRGQVEGMVLRQGLIGPLAGAVVGLALAVPLASLLRSFLLGVPPLDPLSFASASVALLATAAVASWLPARRAARIDPVTALRSE